MPHSAVCCVATGAGHGSTLTIDIMLQAPPNLTPLEEGGSVDGSNGLEASWAALLAAGINDWGGVSPLTRDWVNPEKPWPHVQALAGVTARAGFPLLPRSVDLMPRARG